jgi:predicted nucleic acid-binding protein
MILDTHALSALAEKNTSLIQCIQSAPRLCVTLISLGEYHYGISQSRKQKELSAWLKAFLERAETLVPALSTLPHYADIRREMKLSGTPIPANDCWIAALVREYKMPIVSKDHHFDKVGGILRLNW